MFPHVRTDNQIWQTVNIASNIFPNVHSSFSRLSVVLIIYVDKTIFYVDFFTYLVSLRYLIKFIILLLKEFCAFFFATFVSNGSKHSHK